MDFYRLIYGKSKEEVSEITKKRIDEKEESKKDEEDNVIGFKLDYNPRQHSIDIVNGEKSFGIDLRCFYRGYMRKDTMIVYGMKYNFDGQASNDGGYYYIDDDSYIYEFCDYIKDIEIEDDYDMLFYILDFLNKYFKTIKQVDRETMNMMILKEDGTCFPPIRKHELTDFKGKGNALCSEYAVMAQNLMSIFDIDSAIVIGNEKVKNSDSKDDTYENHAFNIVELTDEETQEKRIYLADFINSIRCIDEKHDLIEKMPFLGDIDEYNDEFVKGLIYGNKKLEYPDYCFLYMGNTIIKLAFERIRSYCISNTIEPNKVLQKKI